MSDVLANVIKGEPDWHALPGDTPHPMRVCVERCLQKDARQRFHDIADVRLAVEGAFTESIDRDTPGRRFSPLAAYAGWGAAVVVAVVAATGIWPLRNPPAPELPETRFEIVTPPTFSLGSLAISPDGRSVVFSGRPSEPLWIRRFDSQEVRALPGTEYGVMPFWSPDSQSIGFFTLGVLKRIDLPGGFVRTLAKAPQPRRGTWNGEGTIIFGAGSIGPLYRVPADGGAVQQATELLPGQTNHRWPSFLPDGRRFLLFSLGSADVRGVYQGSLADRSVRRVSDRESAYGFMPPNHLLFARQGALWARKLNADYSATEGDLVPVAPKVTIDPDATGYGAFSASTNRSIAFRASAALKQLVWLDRAGRTIATVGRADDSGWWPTSLSADGRTATVSRVVDGNPDVWLVDVERGTARRLTTDPGNDGEAVLSPDGSRVVYVADGKDDVYQIHERRSDGTGDPTLVFESDENKNPAQWSPDGRYIAYVSQSPRTNFDLMALPLVGERKPFAVSQTPFSEGGGQFSPDGRWIAYSSDESGMNEVYVQPFPGPGPKVQISVGGGVLARWPRHGRELFYIDLNGHLTSVPLEWRGARIEAGPPRQLFRWPGGVNYEPSADGQRFLTDIVVSDASPISVILNWKPPAR